MLSSLEQKYHTKTFFFLSKTFGYNNSDLKWSKHIKSISGKASKILGMMKRNLWNCPKRIKEIAYTSMTP